MLQTKHRWLGVTLVLLLAALSEPQTVQAEILGGECIEIVGLDAPRAGQAASKLSPKVRSAADAAKRFLGKGYKVKRADDKGFVALSKDGTKRFRLDLTGHGDKPHGHIEFFNGKRWKDAGDAHRYYFSE